MKIIKAGDLSRVIKTHRFECKKCGCVFECNETDCLLEADYRNGILVKTSCPTCNNPAYCN